MEVLKKTEHWNQFFIDNISIKKLWGFKNFDFKFNPNINIIIGPNASGKTTILNLLYYALSGDINNLVNIYFEELVIKLKSFDNKHTRTIKISINESKLVIRIGPTPFEFEMDELTAIRRVNIYRRRAYETKFFQVTELLNKLVPAVWLPVSRRLPLLEDEERERRISRRSNLESVDEKLKELLGELETFRNQLDKLLNARYKIFEKEIFQLLLYDEKFDQFSLSIEKTSDDDEKEHLLSAFEAAGVLDSKIREKIDVHFEHAEKTRQRLEVLKPNKGIPAEDVFLIPLIRRTGSMIELARSLENDRTKIFEPIKRYENIIKEFITSKVITVEDSGNIMVRDLSSGKYIDISVLSSGEKQILILLTQALLWENRPVVYVADEPELSLHVEWQSILIKSLVELGGRIQLIIATHSPDIISTYRRQVINLEKYSK